jgi:hypothetical protein
MVSGAPYTGLQMTTYELMQRASPEGGKGIMWQLLNGAMAGLVAQTGMAPGSRACIRDAACVALGCVGGGMRGWATLGAVPACMRTCRRGLQ